MQGELQGAIVRVLRVSVASPAAELHVWRMILGARQGRHRGAPADLSDVDVR
jgi:hypothetical protein